MKRRDFLKLGALAGIATALLRPLSAKSAETSPDRNFFDREMFQLLRQKLGPNTFLESRLHDFEGPRTVLSQNDMDQLYQAALLMVGNFRTKYGEKYNLTSYYAYYLDRAKKPYESKDPHAFRYEMCVLGNAIIGD